MNRGKYLSVLTIAVCLLAVPTAHAGVTTLDPKYEVIKENNVVVPMSDGTKLVADVYRPKPLPGQPANQRFPCLFEMTPYRKELRAAEAADFFPARGFVYMEVDGRGTGGSSGQYDGVFVEAEQNDGYDAIEWFAKKYPACSGQVGMWGGSYSGVNQYLIATSPKGTPPHLRTIAPQRALSDLYRDIVYTGGIVTGSFGVLWSGATTGFNSVGADPRSGPDPAQAADALTDHTGNDPMLLTYLDRPYDSAFYRASSVIYRLQRLQMPIFHLEGLYDAFTRGQLQTIGRMLELERAGKVKGPNYAVIGPWNHGDSHFLTHPPYDRRILDWYRHWLDGAPKPAWFSEPRINWCEMQEARNGPCKWRQSNSWPPPGTRYRPLYLGPSGSLSWTRPADEGALGSWVYNPTAGQGENGFSKWDNAASVPQRDADQATEDEWKGLTFTTPALGSDLVVHGPVTLSLKASTAPPAGVSLGAPASGPTQTLPPYHDTDLVVKLAEVDEAGHSTLIQSGFLRASHRVLDPSRTRRVGSYVTEPVPWHDEAHLAPPEPGKAIRYEIEVWPTVKRFHRGRRLRIALYSADTANHQTLLKPALNTVFAGSYLLLPTE